LQVRIDITADFDPYRQWLGRTTSERPLNYYQLLDLPELENDRQRIERAEMIEMAKVLRHETGPYALAARRLCEELERAVSTLTNVDSKAAYDAELRARRGPRVPLDDDKLDAIQSRSTPLNEGQTSHPVATLAESPATDVPAAPSRKPAAAPVKSAPLSSHSLSRPRPSLPRVPIKPLVGALCVIGLLWAGFTLWNLAGGKEQPPPAPLVQQGVIDTTLPAAQREKQAVLKGVLDDLEQGTPYSKLKELKPSVRLTESAQGFYRDVIGLERWEFNGKPQGDEVPVVLYMSEDKPGNPVKRVDRVYRVEGSGGQFVISRKK
jgi:hypothetical protein